MKYFAALLLSAVLFVACGDDDSSSFVEPEKESSSSEILSSSDGTSDGNGDKSSSSVSSSSTNSSSSAKSSSSVNSSAGGSSAKSSSSGKNTSASSSAGESSSSLSKKYQCLAECTEDCEGETYWIGTDHQMICHGGQWLNLDSMENANRSSSSRYYDMTEQFNPDVEYGEFTDPRDGQKYRTISMYDDTFERTYVFFAENLNFGKMIAGGTAQGDSTKYCYDNDSWYCENGWGGLYTWSNAMDFPAICDSVAIADESCSQKFNYPTDYMQPQNYVQHQGICPEGWHVVNGGEWAYLEQISGSDVAYKMGSKVARFGSENEYGMSILPAGYWSNQDEVFKVIAKSALFWKPQQHSDKGGWAVYAAVRSNSFDRSSEGDKKQAFSIRCVKNY